MLNFTGSTKKRVVNLGDSRGGNRGRSFLEQAKKDRLEREQAREKERCAILLQLSIRRCFALRYCASEFYNSWLKNGIGEDVNQWCSEVSFIIRFGSRPLLDSVYPSIYDLVNQLNKQLSSRNVTVLVKSLNVGLTRGGSTHMALKCLLLIFDRYLVNEQDRTVFKSMIGNIMKCVTPEHASEAIQLIFRINVADSPESFIDFMVSAPLMTFFKCEEYSKIALSILSQGKYFPLILRLSNRERVLLLLHVLALNNGFFTENDLLTHAWIISATIVPITSAIHDTETGKDTCRQKVCVLEKDYRILLTLVTSTYVRLVFKTLKDSDKSLCVRTLSRLLYLFPESKTSLSMMMSIIPELPLWIYALIGESSCYALYLSLETNTKSVNESLSQDPQQLFGDLIYTYNQILSSWLVVSKDTESFQSESFSLRNVSTYCQFLKAFCFSLIKDRLFGDAPQQSDLKEISISVLNQLYIKNLRLQFLPKLIWKIDDLQLRLKEVIIEPKHDEDLSDDEISEAGVPNKAVSVLRAGSKESFESEILNKVPFFVDFTTRVEILQNSIKADKEKTGLDSNTYFFSDDVNLHKLSADIRRESVLQDAFDSFYKLGSNFKNQLKVTFYNEHGAEAGIDGGGLTKEFLTSVVEEGFSPKNKLKLFKESSSYNLYPNDDIFWKSVNHIDLATQRTRLMYTRFLGMIIGKCLYEGILIDVSFAPSFLSKWRVAQSNLKNSIDDLVFLDPELYANLNKLLEMNEEQLRDLDLNFTIDELVGNKTFLYDLQPPHGAKDTVTTANRLSYIHKVSHFKLNQSLQLQTKNFLEGLFQVIEPNWLNMFDPLELQMLISGGHDINLEDWKANVQYGGYFDDDITITLFWEVVAEMSPQERCDLVKFVTSVSRAPLLGFGVMYPKFGIGNGGSPDRLPTASTCMNLLKLPDYKNKELIREKLLYSIHANSGFDLS